MLRKIYIKNLWLSGPGGVAQLIRVSSQKAKVAGVISSQDTYKNQPMNT